MRLPNHLRRAVPRGRVVAAALLVTSTILVPTACGELRTAPHALHALSVRGGDGQRGVALHRLDEALTVQALDADGAPLANVTVRWTTMDGGDFAPAETVSDAGGYARTVWILGATEGAQHARAVIDGAAPVDFAANASSDPAHDATPLLLSLATSDGSGQTVHPDYVSMPPEWRGDHQYLLITPYPNGDAGFENPSLFAGGPTAWTPPSGVTNPIARPSAGYLSDPDAVAVPETGELWVYYRAVASHNDIYVIRSSDGVKFSAPRLVASAPNHDIVSPAVVRRGPNDWLMWSVNSNEGCSATSTFVELRRSTNGLDWSAPERVSLSQSGFSPWHIDVQWIPSRNEFWAVYNGKTAGSCTTPSLFLATSPDGVHWTTFASPILTHGVIPAFADVVYRSTFAYDPSLDTVDFWYSGAAYVAPNYVWRSAYQRRSRAEVFATAAAKRVLAHAATAPTRNVPPLLDAP